MEVVLPEFTFKSTISTEGSKNAQESQVIKNNSFNFKTFDELKVSNIVGIYKFEPMLNLNVIFRLCQLNNSSKIYYMNYQGHSRGKRLQNRKKKKTTCVKCFKNSISIDMDESLGLKLSQNSLQLSGFKSKDVAEHALKVLTSELNNIESFLVYIDQHLEEATRCINFIKDNFKGDTIYQIEGTRIIVDSKDVIIYGSNMYLNFNSSLYSYILKDPSLIPANSIKGKLTNQIQNNTNNTSSFNVYPIIEIVKVHSIKSLASLTVPPDISFHLIEFLLDKITDFNNFEEYSLNLDWFLTLKSVCDTPPVRNIDSISIHHFEMKNIQFSYGNINYNYNLGFPVKLAIIDRIFKRNSEFVSAYDKDIVKFVRISLSMDIPDDLALTVKNKLKKPSHKFIIYKTGSIFQSGYHPILNKIAFDKFMNVVSKNIGRLRNDSS